MLFNNDQCKCLHIGHANSEGDYQPDEYNGVTFKENVKGCRDHCKFGYKCQNNVILQQEKVIRH